MTLVPSAARFTSQGETTVQDEGGSPPSSPVQTHLATTWEPHSWNELTNQ
jgi:hypothetical protein